MTTQTDVAVLQEKVRVAEEKIQSHQDMADNLRLVLRAAKYLWVVLVLFGTAVLGVLGYQHWWVIPAEIAKLAATDEMEEAAARASEFNRLLPLHAWCQFDGGSINNSGEITLAAGSGLSAFRVDEGRYVVVLTKPLSENRRVVFFTCTGRQAQAPAKSHFSRYIRGQVADATGGTFPVTGGIEQNLEKPFSLLVNREYQKRSKSLFRTNMSMLWSISLCSRSWWNRLR